MYALRGDISRDLPQRVEATVRDGIAAQLDHRVGCVEAGLAQLQQFQTMGKTREDNVARYLEEFHGVRPMEGGVVQAGFQQLAADIAQVQAQMQQLEAFAAAAGPAVAVQPSSQPPQ